jgi:predicted HAD superfamily Cof-like phosphohydrolase
MNTYDGPGVSPMAAPTPEFWELRRKALEERMKENSVVTTNFSKVQVFHRVFGQEPDPEKPTIPSERLAALRADLIEEETKEALDELDQEIIDLSKVAKELADILYVVYGTAASFGIPIDEVFDQVHTSNMSKLTADGQVLRREDGKVLKSDQYKPVDLSWLTAETK